MPKHVVEKGDCISSIADTYGFSWKTIWNHGENANLRQKRKDPNVLCPKDVVFIPELNPKDEPGSTGQTHRFRKGTLAKIRIRLLDEEGRALADEPYVLEIDGKTHDLKTDAGGDLEHWISPTAKKGKLLVGEAKEELELDLGHVDPVDETTGVQARLRNLGCDCGEIDGDLGPRTKAALQQFQGREGLERTGRPDEKTRKKLEEMHGS